jgi:hypothetical protein
MPASSCSHYSCQKHNSNLFSDSAEEYLDPLLKLEEMCNVRQEVAGIVCNYSFICKHPCN